MILGIKTAGETGELVLGDAKSGKVLARISLALDRSLSEKILTRLMRLLANKRLSLKDVTKIVIYRGPGSFTSLRIGHAVANTLAFGLSIPIAGVTETQLKGRDFSESLGAIAKTAKEGTTVLPFYGKAPNITRPRVRKY